MRKAWLDTTRVSESPLALASRMYCWMRTSRIAERPRRISAAQSQSDSAMVGITNERAPRVPHGEPAQPNSEQIDHCQAEDENGTAGAGLRR